MNSAQARRRFYARHHQSDTRAAIGIASHVVRIPENVERRETHVPCFKCESRGGCRHRPWLNDPIREFA
jgi:hypothetical protein